LTLMTWKISTISEKCIQEIKPKKEDEVYFILM
jgi:hypothetical protein